MRAKVFSIALLAAAVLGVSAGVSHLPHVNAAAPAAVSAPAVSQPAAVQTLPDFAAIAEANKGAVVNITSTSTAKAEAGDGLPEGLENLPPQFRRFFEQQMPQAPRIRQGMGSGFIVDADGTILTNAHVVDGADEVRVRLSDRREFKGKVIGQDKATDIAVVKIEARALATLPWGDSSRAAVGEYVVAIGNPFQLNQTVTMGIISATGRSNVGIVDYEDFIQTDAAINPGNSGGALLNTRGELIGINTAIYSETGGYQGIGFAVPANLARTVVDQLVRKGRVVRGWIGITKISDVADDSGLEAGQGVVIVELLRGSPADRAGIEPGDVVIAVDGRTVETASQLRNELAGARVGTELRLTLRREGRRLQVLIPIEEARGRV